MQPSHGAPSVMVLGFGDVGYPVQFSRLVPLGSSFALESLQVGASRVSGVLLDTGSSDTVLMSCSRSRLPPFCFDQSGIGPADTNPSSCVSLLEDGGDIVEYSRCSAQQWALTATSDGEQGFHASLAKTPTAAIWVARSFNATGEGNTRSWVSSGGLMGLGFPSLSSKADGRGLTAFQQLLWNAVDPTSSSSTSPVFLQGRHVVGIDFRDPGDSAGSWLHWGGLAPPGGSGKSPQSGGGSNGGSSGGGSRRGSGNSGTKDREAAAPSVQWAEPAEPADLSGALHSLRVHHLSLCGASLLRPHASSWPAIVDTGTSCLGLPSEVFDAFAAALPPAVHCEFALEQGGLCYVDANFTVRGQIQTKARLGS